MTTRIISGAVGLILFAFVFFVFPLWVTPLAIALISAFATYELVHATGSETNRYLFVLSILFSACYAPLSYFLPIFSLRVYAFLFLAFAFLSIILKPRSAHVYNLTFAFFAGIIIPALLSTLIDLIRMSHGRFLFLLPFLGAFLTDTFAYFIGSLQGKHPLIPEISPHKTIEGSIGGTLGCIMGIALYAVILDLFFDKTPNYLAFILYAFLAAVFAQLGDLAMSAIKRQFGIKDYGTIMPGHGGVLDRFDSVLFTAPLALLFVLVFPNIIQ